MPTILVTGAAGYIGGYILPALRQRYTVRLVDNRATGPDGQPMTDLIVRALGDVTDLDAQRDLFQGVEAVVHLAFIRPVGPGAHQRYLAERANIDLAYVVYQLALEEGARRVVVASSNHAADYYEAALRERRLDMIYPDSPRPLADNFYGWSKEAYEHLGFVYATGHLGRRLEVVQLRIGAPRDLAMTSFVDPARTPARLHRDLGMWVSPRDLAQLVIRSLDTPDIRDQDGVPFQVFYGISGNTRSAWSIANARRVIGYAPEDDSEVVYAEQIRADLLEPARARMVAGPDRGGLGHRPT